MLINGQRQYLSPVRALISPYPSISPPPSNYHHPASRCLILPRHIRPSSAYTPPTRHTPLILDALIRKPVVLLYTSTIIDQMKQEKKKSTPLQASAPNMTHTIPAFTYYPAPSISFLSKKEGSAHTPAGCLIHLIQIESLPDLCSSIGQF